MANIPRLGRADDRKRMVVGFALNDTMSRVLLQLQRRGPFVGYWNGLGGHAKARENYRQAMRREFLEESGVLVHDWSLMAIVDGDSYRMFAYTAILTKSEWRRTLRNRKLTDETLQSHALRDVIKPHGANACAFDVPWLVALAISDDSIVKVDRRLI